MRFIHIADVHLGAEPDAGTAYSKRRPDELWETFSEVVSLCEQEQTDLLLIAGDLFHRQPLLRELKEVDYLFSKLTHTEVVLIAGNHDHIRKDSYYRTFSWSENVHPLFGNRPQYLVLEHLDTAVYGFSYETKEILEPRYDGFCLHMEGTRSTFRSMGMHSNEADLTMWRWGISTSRRLSSKGWRHMRGRWSRPIKMIPENMGLSGEKSGAERRRFLLYRLQSGNICILR